MASQRAADAARTTHEAALKALGAHAIAVDVMQRNRKRTFGVIAYFETRPTNVPKTLPVAINGRTVNVPVSVRIAPKFRIEHPP
jgi:hypothetical protein